MRLAEVRFALSDIESFRLKFSWSSGPIYAMKNPNIVSLSPISRMPSVPEKLDPSVQGMWGLGVGN